MLILNLNNKNIWFYENIQNISFKKFKLLWIIKGIMQLSFQNNKFINISSKYENDEENALKLEEIFERNNAYIFENLFKF